MKGIRKTNDNYGLCIGEQQPGVTAGIYVVGGGQVFHTRMVLFADPLFVSAVLLQWFGMRYANNRKAKAFGPGFDLLGLRPKLCHRDFME